MLRLFGRTHYCPWWSAITHSYWNSHIWRMTRCGQFFGERNVCVEHLWRHTRKTYDKLCRGRRACLARRNWHWTQEGLIHCWLVFSSSEATVQNRSRLLALCNDCSSKWLKRCSSNRGRWQTDVDYATGEVCSSTHCPHLSHHGQCLLHSVDGVTAHEVQILVSAFSVRGSVPFPNQAKFTEKPTSQVGKN